MTDQQVTARDEGSSNSQLISASVLMATGTMASRLVGFLRVVLIAFVLGNGTKQVEMFTFANTIPNSIYILLAGGALNTVLVPQIVRAVKHDKDRGEAYTNRIMTAFLLILAVVTLAVTIAAPLIIRLYTDGQWREPALSAQYDSMVTLAYLCLPQVFFYGAFFLAGQVLNARGRFGPMMWAPVANNLVSIAVFGLYLALWGVGDGTSAFTTTQEWVLGGGATLGILIQAAIMVPFLRSAGFHYRPRFDLRHTGLGHTFHLAKWTLGFVVVTQAALVVVNRLASRAVVGGDGGGGGGLTVYNNAYLLWILPHSLITVSLATAMLPSASRLAAQGDLAGVRDESIRTMRLATTVLLPASVAFLALAIPITDLLFNQGAGSQDWIYIAWALMGFAVGLVPFTLHYVCLRTFYALEDTRSTFSLQVIIALANAALAVALVLLVHRPTLVAASLALAYSLAYGLGVVLAFRWLGRKLPGLSAAPVLRHCLRVFLAVLPGGLAAAAITRGFRQWSVSKPAVALSLVAAGVVAVGLFLLLARLLHITEVNQIVATVTRRNRSSEDGESPGTGDSGARGPGSSPTIEGAGETAGVAAMGIPTMGEQDETDQVPAQTGARPVGADPEATAEFVPDFDDPDADSADPDSPHHEPGAADDFTDVSPTPQLSTGDVLGGRYRVEEVLGERGSAITWRAFDQVLSRSVVCHLVGRDDPRCPDILAAARRAAAATDSRFLRVLDAVQPDEGEVGCYIVTEYSAGHTVQDLLAAGPLSGLEAAWLVREVSDAIAGVHALGLSHLRINPKTIIVTPTGNVQISGLLIEEAFAPERGGLPAEDQPEDPQERDVLDLGRLLLATLVSRWPGGAEFGLPEAPRDGQGHWLTPRQVRAGVSPALDQIADQVLSPTPRHHAAPLESAGDIVQALSKVLGSADASTDLERRLRQPVPMVGAHDDAPRSPSTAWYEQSHEAETAALPAATEATVPPARVATPPPGSPATPRTAPAERPPRRRWLAWVILLVVVAILLTVGVLYLNGRGTGGGAGDQASSDASVEAGPYEIVDAVDFDPEADNGSGDENPDEVPLAHDGDPETRWRTLAYKNNPQMGGLKPGVGLVLDLGEAREVGSVGLVLTGAGTAVEVRVPANDPASLSEPPLETEADWRTVGADDKAGASASIGLAEKVTTRFVLVYLTSLPKEDGIDYRGAIHEVEVLG